MSNMVAANVLIFSETLEEHLTHIHSVLKRLLDVGLKLKPGKCKFLRKEVEYLGYILTPLGLKPTQRHVEDFPVPINMKGVRQFLGLASDIIDVLFPSSLS